MRDSSRVPGASARRGSHIAILGLLMLAAAGCGDVLGSGDQPQEQLLFVSSRGDDRQLGWSDLNKDIYRMNADGTGVENLTRHPAKLYRSLSVSPDGSRVVFNTDRSGCYDIWAIDTDGTSPLRLTNAGEENHRCNYAPRWSRDGTRIALTTTREQNYAVYVMNADGGSPRNVSTPVETGGGLGYPASWLPDGRLAFQYAMRSGGVGSVRTYVVNADGTGLTPLLQPGDESPVWSPDGSRIAFLSVRDGSRRLYVMDADGSNVRKLSNLTGEDVFAQTWGHWENDHTPWSPDGKRIAFTNFSDQTSGIYVANADGSGLRRLTEPGFAAGFNGWSPRGTRIALTSAAAGSLDVYVINADGTGLVNLTPGAGHDSDALWLPRR